MEYVFILGRQPELGIAELECLYGSNATTRLSASTALVSSSNGIDIQTIGGSSKAGKVVASLPLTSWPSFAKKLETLYTERWSGIDYKQTVGISVYDWDPTPKQIQGVGINLKMRLKKAGVSMRLLPNQTSALNSAVSHHNKLGLSANKVELLIVRGKEEIFVAESIGAQNITALARRDQGRPKRDAFVGMLPPKLALMLVNMANPSSNDAVILDPFCGTGVVLQEAMLRGYNVYGSDLSDKMIDYSGVNLDWLKDELHAKGSVVALEQGDAMTHTWTKPIDAVVAEGYLGQPFSAPPRPEKLKEVVKNCDHIISSFLKNLHPQLQPGTPVILAVPAWRDARGQLTQLPLTGKLTALGYRRMPLSSISVDDLVYFRDDQVVARKLLLVTRD